MDFDIVIVRVHDGYRVAHGHLHLASALNTANEAVAYVPGEGNVKVVKTRRGFLVGKDSQCYEFSSIERKQALSATQLHYLGLVATTHH